MMPMKKVTDSEKTFDETIAEVLGSDASDQ
jgi:hypothetical protein